ncbi:hypothetical protein ATI02_3689 [Pseudomonas baetica]|uniref:Uncharacterized protein n=1 Tax=Pseudomonas baetica TaxID=674054 RepID=A0ABX4Q1U5_9PSED|nr:hypothetical protein [Pseudomonas baetica]MDR9860917.1 hypothetical protein [Pseudomonas baetica]PKA70764.1 hypothetical protein ATI02_3689 [Pseudomonas baetica]PTC16245.1 hypothetical protein C0J26_28455 [Pseudomonas baetica]
MEAKSTTPPTESNSEGQKVSVVIENLSVENPTPGHKYKDVIDGRIYQSQIETGDGSYRYCYELLTDELVFDSKNKNGEWIIDVSIVRITE